MTKPNKKQAPQKRTITSKPQKSMEAGNSKPQPKPKAGKLKPKPQTSLKSGKHRPVTAGARKLKLQAKPKINKLQKATRFKPQLIPKPQLIANAAEIHGGANAEAKTKAQEPESENNDTKGLKAETETNVPEGFTFESIKKDGLFKAQENQKPTAPVYEPKSPAQKRPINSGAKDSEAKEPPQADAKNNEAEVRTKAQNTPKLNIHLTLKKIGADFVAYDLEHKTAFKLDPLAFLICTLCDGRNTTAQIAQKLEALLRAENLAPPVKSLGAEVETVINALSQNGVVFVD